MRIYGPSMGFRAEIPSLPSTHSTNHPKIAESSTERGRWTGELEKKKGSLSHKVIQYIISAY